MRPGVKGTVTSKPPAFASHAADARRRLAVISVFHARGRADEWHGEREPDAAERRAFGAARARQSLA